MRKFYTPSGIYMAAILAAVCLTGITCRPKNAPSEVSNVPVKALAEGLVSLFDGTTLDGWEITNFGPQGPVYVSDGQIFLEMGDAITGINRTGGFPVMNYEVTLEAMKVAGNDFFCGMTFPVEESFCSLIVGGWSGTVVGLSNIDGLDASENETTTYRGFDQDTWYRIRLRVTPGKIEAWIDNEQVIDLETTGRTLSTRPETGLSRPFGIASWRTTAALRKIVLKTL